MFEIIAYSNDSAFLESFPQQLAAKFAEYAPRLVRVRGRSPAQLSLFAEEDIVPDLYFVHLGDDPDSIMGWLEERQLPHLAPVMILAPGADWAMRAYDAEVQFYQRTPPDMNRIAELILRRFSLRRQEEQPPLPTNATEQFAVRTAAGTQVVPFSQIVHVEYSGHRLLLHLTGGKRLATTTMRLSFGDAAAPLLRDARFVRTHASFLVNISHVVQFGAYALTMDSGVTVPVSHAKKAEVKRKFSTYYAAAPLL